MFGISAVNAWDRRPKHLFVAGLLALPILVGVACIQIQREPDTISASENAHEVVPIFVQTQPPMPTAKSLPNPASEEPTV